jgi:hypothetical protein
MTVTLARANFDSMRMGKILDGVLLFYQKMECLASMLFGAEGGFYKPSVQHAHT